MTQEQDIFIKTIVNHIVKNQDTKELRSSFLSLPKEFLLERYCAESNTLKYFGDLKKVIRAKFGENESESIVIELICHLYDRLEETTPDSIKEQIRNTKKFTIKRSSAQN